MGAGGSYSGGGAGGGFPSQSPPTATSTAFGDLADQNVRRLFTDILFTMNTVFPDYDFSDKKASAFSLCNAWAIRSNINKQFSTGLGGKQQVEGGSPHLTASSDVDIEALLPQLWTVIEEIIGSLEECVVFT
jgi:hypothetical protein